MHDSASVKMAGKGEVGEGRTAPARLALSLVPGRGSLSFSLYFSLFFILYSLILYFFPFPGWRLVKVKQTIILYLHYYFVEPLVYRLSWGRQKAKGILIN